MRSGLMALWWCGTALVSAVVANNAYGSDRLGTVTATAGILIHRATGDIVWERNADLALPPASTTKVLTALIALESARRNDAVQVSRTAAQASPSKIYLRPGWSMRVDDLVYALLLKSANDAAEVVAEGLSGSVPEFAYRMTQRARQLGAHNSTFLNPHGLPQEGHLSTARDLTTIFEAAMRNPDFRQVALTKTAVIQPVRGGKRRIALRNHNRLLDGYQVPVIGKTGYTIAAKRCFVGAALGGYGDEYLVAVLGSRDLWGDLTKVLDQVYGTEPSRPNQDLQVARTEDDIVPQRLRVAPAARKQGRPDGRTASPAGQKKKRRATEVAKVTVRSASGETRTVSIGDVDEEDRIRKVPAKGANGRYVVQLATLGSAARAEQLRAAVGRKGYAAVIRSAGTARKKEYRVRVEGFASRQAAERAAARLKQSAAGVKPIILGAGG